MSKIRWIAATSLAVAAMPVAAASIGGFSPYRLAEIVKTISADDFEGRGVNTPAETKTVNYIIDEFRSAGLQPGGDVVNGRRKWTQDVPLLQSALVGDPVVTVQTSARPIQLAQRSDIAVRSPQNGQDRIAIANAPLVFAGYGVAAPERNWDDFKGQDVRGKVIVVLINDPDFEGGEGDFGGKAMTYYGRWTYKFEEAARRGAAGVMIVHETAPASYGWATVKNSNTDTQFDIVRQNPAATHTPFETWIQRDVAVRLFKAAGLDFEAAKAASRRRDFTPIDLKATINATASAKVSTITSHNVVGLLPGKKYPDETIIYSAHWDHLGIGLPDATGDKIYNGAVDNGTGIAQLIQQARRFALEPRPERSIVFLAVTAEEKGLLGSEYYATHPLYPLAKTVAVFNTDAMNVWGPEKNFSIRGTARLGLLDELIAAGKAEGRYFTPDPHPETGGFYRSDHFSFAKVGVPAVSFSSGNDLVTGGTARNDLLSADYTAKRYHQPADEFNPKWDFRGLAQDANLLHIVGEKLANSREWPNWSADSEFRAARDKSEAERANAMPAPAAAPPKKGERG
jgi:Zn-dependent M28 family amino/carboxypeptidase